MKIQQQYELACKKYIEKFCKKQEEMEFTGWVANQVGGIALCNDFYFNFHDIVWDVNSNQKKGLIVDWYYDCLDNPTKSINYFSYTKGLRISDIKDDDSTVIDSNLQADIRNKLTPIKNLISILQNKELVALQVKNRDVVNIIEREVSLSLESIEYLSNLQNKKPPM